MQVHGHVRTTQDVDVIADWTTQNMSRLGAALRDLDAGLPGIDADLLGIDLTDPRQLLDGGNFLLHTRHGDLDVFDVDQTAGAPADYSRLRDRALRIQLGEIVLLVADPEDLIRMTTAAANVRDRPEAKRRQDLDDIAVLERLRSALLGDLAGPSPATRSTGGSQRPNPETGERPRRRSQPPANDKDTER